MKKIYWNSLSDTEKLEALARPILSNNEDVRERVKEIIQEVKCCKDQALLALTERYDRVKLSELRVTAAEFERARNFISREAKQAIEFAKKQIQTNHSAQLPKPQSVQTCEGVKCERQARPIQRVGLYIPGGTAPLVSTVLMLCVPAQLADCPLRVMCTPPNKNGEIDPHILFAAELCGVTNIYKVGGAQSIAAMAYGTQSIPKVDKIVGPGNAWVTQAKMLVAQDPEGASIDMPAGPSEVMVIGDGDANPEYVAADLLSQAEHGPDSQVIFVTTSAEIANEVESEIHMQLAELQRYEIAKQSLEYSRIIVVNDLSEAISISNSYAPEHLILQVSTPEQYVSLIQNAGAVFLGKWAPETVGDYVTGSNHVLPTYGYAKSYSGLSVADFMKWISFQTLTQAGLTNIGRYAEKIAEIEGLDAHKRAVTRRLAKMEMINE